MVRLEHEDCMMKLDTLTVTETREAIVIRIPRGWFTDSRRRRLTEAEVLRVVSSGEREFRRGKTQAFSAFLARRYPAYARVFRRAR